MTSIPPVRSFRRRAMPWLALGWAAVAPPAVATVLRITPLQIGQTPTSLAQTLAGCGVTILDVRYRGTSLSSGTFTGGSDYVGMDAGVVLSTGAVGYDHQNTTESFGTDTGLPGDADLETLETFTTTAAGMPVAPTFDATSLDIEFLTPSTTVLIDFSFASDEYNENASAPFSDLFAFFVNGANIALLPNGSPVSIANVNAVTNPQDYVCNATGSDSCTISLSSGWSATRFNGFELDGLTVVFTATATLSGDPFHVNHLRIVVADANNPAIDSAVFIRAGSFSVPGCVPPLPPPAPPVAPPPGDAKVNGFPNPFRPGSGGAQAAATITFRSVPSGGRVRVYTQAGEFVVELHDTAGTGRVTWDGRNEYDRRVESGVYEVVASSPDGRVKSRGRIVIIR